MIPNGKGKWKKTNPKIDRERVIAANQNNDGKLLEVIRLVKKWNKVKNVKTMPSYLLETILVNYGEQCKFCINDVDHSFVSALNYIAQHICKPIYDLKEIQGNINSLVLIGLQLN